MFIDRNSKKTIRRSEERNVSRVVPVYLSSAPPNGAGGICLAQTEDIRPVRSEMLNLSPWRYAGKVPFFEPSINNGRDSRLTEHLC